MNLLNKLPVTLSSTLIATLVPLSYRAALLLFLSFGATLIGLSLAGSPAHGKTTLQLTDVYQGQGSGGGPEQLMIILDASGSMEEELPGGETKMAAAKRTIFQLMDRIPTDMLVGLRVYGTGGSGPWGVIDPCRDTKLVVSPQQGSQNLIKNSIMGIRPNGATPISFSLVTALQKDFNPNLAGKKRIVLISDGQETCDADPCAVAVEMVRRGVQVKIDVVGFGQMEPATVQQLKCISAATYGEFHRATTSAELLNKLSRSVKAQTSVQGVILRPGGSSGGEHPGNRTAPSTYQNRPSVKPARKSAPVTPSIDLRTLPPL